jgi:prolyl 4-hydroxylase
MDDPVVRCIVTRAATFQGYLSPSLIEPLQVVRYRTSEHFSLHHDAFEKKGDRPNRRSSFFVILKSEDVVHGGTNFPHIEPFRSGSEQNTDRWCDVMDCGEEGKIAPEGSGTVMRPVAGSANFWLNLNDDGTRKEELWHAGDRLTAGTKYGMNIFSWTAEPAPQV